MRRRPRVSNASGSLITAPSIAGAVACHVLAHHPSHTAQANQCGTCEGVADAGHRLDGALTVAHAVWYFAGALLGGRPKERALTRSLRDLTRFAKWARVGAECLGAFERVG